MSRYDGGKYVDREITITHLQMDRRDQLKGNKVDREDVRVEKCGVALPEYNRFFYTTIGGEYHWVDRRQWTYEQWRAYLDRPCLTTWVMYVKGTPAGYFELEAQADGISKVVYFGLLKEFRGEGLGGHLLTVAVEEGWALYGAKGVYLNTCTADGPHALANYLARGFEVTGEETRILQVPEDGLGPWDGA